MKSRELLIFHDFLQILKRRCGLLSGDSKPWLEAIGEEGLAASTSLSDYAFEAPEQRAEQARAGHDGDASVRQAGSPAGAFQRRGAVPPRN